MYSQNTYNIYRQLYCIQVLPLQVHKNKPVYNRLQSSNAGDGQSFQSKYVHTEEVKQTARE
jgi:hypothetical protein